MRKVNRIDAQGLYVEDVILKDNESTPADCIEVPCPGGFYLPKWDALACEWVEGLTPEQIVAKLDTIPLALDAKATAIDEISKATTIAGLRTAMLKFVNAE